MPNRVISFTYEPNGADIKVFETRLVYELGVCTAPTMQYDADFRQVDGVSLPTIIAQCQPLVALLTPNVPEAQMAAAERSHFCPVYRRYISQYLASSPTLLGFHQTYL